MKTQSVVAEPVVFERTYNAPIAKVWKAITSKEDMKHWYFDIAEFKPEVGFEFSFVGGEEGGEQYVHLCKVLEVIPQKRLKYSWRYQGYEGNSFVTWELFSEGKSKTRVKLTHEGLETFPKTKDFARECFVEGWTSLIGAMLLDYVEVTDLVKTIEINAPVEQVWQMLVTLEAVTNWAQSFSEGTVVESDFQEGSPIVWKNHKGEIGASGVVSERIENQKLVFYYVDGEETYTEEFELTSKDGKTVLTAKSGPLARLWAKVHDPQWDKALRKIAEGVEK
jgi:uncharacterized protein YndB with AHSA1/START domain